MSTPGNDSQSSAVEFTEELVGPFSAFFNQSSGFPFEIDGTQYLSLEHYFQSKKFSGTPHEETIIKAKTTQEAHKHGRSRKFPLRSDWESVKNSVMERGIEAKFTQNESLRNLLLSTGDREIKYISNNDPYWGLRKTDKQGENYLGKMLMALRAKLNK